MSNQSEAALFVEANRSEALTIIRAPGELQFQIVICTSGNTIWRTTGLKQDSMEHAEPTPTLFYSIPILRR
jgi:hypothetical protein